MHETHDPSTKLQPWVPSVPRWRLLRSYRILNSLRRRRLWTSFRWLENVKKTSTSALLFVDTAAWNPVYVFTLTLVGMSDFGSAEQKYWIAINVKAAAFLALLGVTKLSRIQRTGCTRPCSNSAVYWAWFRPWGLQFKSRPGHRLLWVMFFMYFLSTSKKVPEQHLQIGNDDSSFQAPSP